MSTSDPMGSSEGSGAIYSPARRGLAGELAEDRLPRQARPRLPRQAGYDLRRTATLAAVAVLSSLAAGPARAQTQTATPTQIQTRTYAVQSPQQSSAQAAAGVPGIAAPENDSLEPLQPVSASNAADAAGAARAIQPAESLGNDDLLEIMVPYCPELSRNFRVGSDGTLSLPLLRQPIQVAGLTPMEVAARIKQALITGQVLADPTVSVSVLEYRSHPVSVVGAVVHPLTFQATGETTLLDAIAQAGGLTPAVGGDILVTTRTITPKGTIESQVLTIPVRGLIGQADPAYNVRLRGGEEVRIPEAAKVFVAGNVHRPGMYPMQGDEDTTVIKALALSEGLAQYSANVAYIYRRKPGGGEREEIKVPLARIVARKDPDVALMADDILYIPENGGKRMTARVLNQIAGFGAATATGLLIYK